MAASTADPPLPQNFAAGFGCQGVGARDHEGLADGKALIRLAGVGLGLKLPQSGLLGTSAV